MPIPNATPPPWYSTDHIEPVYSVIAYDDKGKVVRQLVGPRYKDSKGVCQADLDAISAVHEMFEALEQAPNPRELGLIPNLFLDFYLEWYNFVREKAINKALGK